MSETPDQWWSQNIKDAFEQGVSEGYLAWQKVKSLRARVAKLESEKIKLDARMADLQRERDYWENKCLALEGRGDE